MWLRKHIHTPGSGRVVAMILLFGQTRIRFYYLGENEKMILLFGVGRGYEFTDGQKESGGARM